MKSTYHLPGLLALLHALSSVAQQGSASNPGAYLTLDWKQVATGMPAAWYASREAKMVADSVLKYQTGTGGWPKNNAFHRGMDQEEWARIRSSGIGATFDNGATLTEMKFLARMYRQTAAKAYWNAFVRGFDYILKAQYDNGGWPQFYPVRKGGAAYSSQITYNDDAMVNIMRLLKGVAEADTFYAALPISGDMRLKAQQAFDKGVKCMLQTQINRNGKPTVWCAQHDEVTLLPAKARAYELPSFSGYESAGITLLLMEIRQPSDAIRRAVNGAITWFEQHRIEGIRVKDTINSEGLKDRVVISDPAAPTHWARFYDLETEKPFFCDRDGIKRERFSELGHNRRNGYSWYTTAPQKVLHAYPAWVKQWNVNQ